jgi:hypothetical protein
MLKAQAERTNNKYGNQEWRGYLNTDFAISASQSSTCKYPSQGMKMPNNC